MFFGGKTVSFAPEKDIPSLQGKVILVSGGNIGLGKQCILEYSQHSPRQIWLGARSLDKAKAAVDEIRNQVGDAPIKLLQMVLSSFESIKQAAKTLIAESDRLDILMLNAGVMACAPGLTDDGKLLLPLLDKTAKSGPESDVRIVSLSSTGHNLGPKEGIVFESLKTTASDMGTLTRYGQSKLANIFFARHLAKLNPHLTVAAVHPGVVRTNLTTGASGLPAPLRLLAPLVAYLSSSVDQGARNQLWASVSKDVKSGEYYEPIGVADRCRELGKDDGLAKRLWDWTEEELDKALSDQERPSKPSPVKGNL